MSAYVHHTNRPYNVPRPSGSIENVAPPEGCATTADVKCADCMKPLPLQWRRETFASGRVAIYPVLADGCRVGNRGLARCPGCAS